MMAQSAEQGSCSSIGTVSALLSSGVHTDLPGLVEPFPAELSEPDVLYKVSSESHTHTYLFCKFNNTVIGMFGWKTLSRASPQSGTSPF